MLHWCVKWYDRSMYPWIVYDWDKKKNMGHMAWALITYILSDIWDYLPSPSYRGLANSACFLDSSHTCFAHFKSQICLFKFLRSWNLFEGESVKLGGWTLTWTLDKTLWLWNIINDRVLLVLCCEPATSKAWHALQSNCSEFYRNQFDRIAHIQNLTTKLVKVFPLKLYFLGRYKCIC